MGVIITLIGIVVFIFVSLEQFVPLHFINQSAFLATALSKPEKWYTLIE